MKKIISIVLFLFTLFASVYWNTSLLNGTATGDNVKMDFSDSDSLVWVEIDAYTWNICNTWKSWFPLTWYVNREWNWFVYFSEDDGDDTVDTCVSIVLSGSDFYLTWVWATDSWTWYAMHFNNIKLNYDASLQAYKFDGEAIDDALWAVSNWTDVYVTWLNLIDWSKTIVDYSELTWWKYANWTSGTVNIFLKDVAWNPVHIVDSLDIELTSTSSDIDGYTFLNTNWDKKVTLDVDTDTWGLKIPVYIIKAINNWEIELKISYKISDTDWNTDHTLKFDDIELKNPVEKMDITFPGTSIVWVLWTWDIDVSYYEKWLIDNTTTTWYVSTDSKYTIEISNFSAEEWQFNLLVKPSNVDDTLSKVDSKFESSKYNVKFDEFGWKVVSYDKNFDVDFVSFADKRVDYDKSFSWLNLSWISYIAWSGSIDIKPILRDKNWFRIPDVSYNIKLKDANEWSVYSTWDCNEIQWSYQTDCTALQFISNSNLYSWNVDGVLWTSFAYEVGDSDYKNISIISYKPITWWKIDFEITDLKNIKTDWNFTNSGDYIDLPSFDGKIENIHFSPYLNIRLAGLDDDLNYVDINNSLQFKLKNILSTDIKVTYNLSWEITKPIDWVEFREWWKLTWENITLNSQDEKSNLEDVLFSFDYMYNEDVKFNYNHWQYTIDTNDVAWELVLVPWDFYFNLWWTYKFWWVYVSWLINKIQKYATSVKNSMWKSTNMATNFSHIYNKLRKKVAFIIQWLTADTTSSEIKFNKLNWWVKYYKCVWTNEMLTIWTWTYHNSNLVIIEDCKLFIKWNIYKWNNNDNLVIFAFNSKKNEDLRDSNFLEEKSNIYIAENVSDIEAALFTKSSIFTIDWSEITDVKNQINMSNRIYTVNDKQLYINGSVMSKNNIGWSFLVAWEDKFTIWSSLKVFKNSWIWWASSTSELRSIAQIFDFNSFRWFKFDWANSLSEDWYSSYCKNHKTEEWCRYPVYIKYDSTIRQNILFR